MCYMGRYTVSGSGADCKSVVFDSGGSTPSLPTIAMGFVASTCGTSFLDGGFLPTSSLILITHGIGNKCHVYMAGWSSGEDIRFSFWDHEFDSRTGYHEYGSQYAILSTYTTGNVILSIPHPLPG